MHQSMSDADSFCENKSFYDRSTYVNEDGVHILDQIIELQVASDDEYPDFVQLHTNKDGVWVGYEFPDHSVLAILDGGWDTFSPPDFYNSEGDLWLLTVRG